MRRSAGLLFALVVGIASTLAAGPVANAQGDCDPPDPPILRTQVSARAAGDKFTRISVKSDGSQSPLRSDLGDLSADGRVAAIYANDDLIIGDEATDRDCDDDEGFGLFVVNTETFAMKRILPYSNHASLSGDGSKIAYDGSGVRVEDVNTGNETTLGSGAHPLISDDGSAVVYEQDERLVWQSSNGGPEITVYSVTDQIAWDADISADGRFVVFDTRHGIDPGDINGFDDVYIWDKNNPTQVTLVSTGPNGPGNGFSDNPLVSADGKFVFFESSSTNFADFPVSSTDLLWRKNMNTGALKLVGKNGKNERVATNLHAISDDGNVVAFDDVFDNRTLVRNISENAVDKVITGDRVDFDAELTGDGETIAFNTPQALIGSDTNGQQDVYLKGPRPVTCPAERFAALQTAGTCALVVNETGDRPDEKVTDGICETDRGDCTLRAAIQEANERAGADLITFDIPGAGPHVIRVDKPLPNVKDMTIDATSQPGWSEVSPIQLKEASETPDTGLFAAGKATIRGLSFMGFKEGVYLSKNGNTVQSSSFGTQAQGRNRVGIFITGHDNFIGGTGTQRNVISGNRTGIRIEGEAGTANRVEGNLIGVLPDSTTRSNDVGISVSGFNSGTIGGTGFFAGNTISGNKVAGIEFDSAQNKSTVLGNHIGTNTAGDTAVPNDIGILIHQSHNQQIGQAVDTGNLISGNTTAGIVIRGHPAIDANDNKIIGNRIGINAEGTTYPTGNRQPLGIKIVTGSNTTIGGAGVERNVISGNKDAGISISGKTATTSVIGNYIGVGPEGAGAVPNDIGIEITGGKETHIGFPNLDRNVIAGNQVAGINIEGTATSPLSSQVFVQNNRIGQSITGAGNGNGYGILVEHADGVIVGGRSNLVPGECAGPCNLIVDNFLHGISVAGENSRVRINGNSISANVSLGIDLGLDDEITPNDAKDVDKGANGLQNFPLLAGATAGGSVTGAIDGPAGKQLRLEFFLSPSCDSSGNGEGMTYLGTADVTLDDAGSATFEFESLMIDDPGVVTATATTTRGHTSEFSPCASVD